MINWPSLDSHLAAYRAQFNSAKPFRYVVIEDLLDPEAVKRIEAGFETALSHKDHGSAKSHKNVLLKTGTPNLKLMTPDQAGFFEAINSDRFLKFMTEITQVDPIYPDPQLNGGGLHSSVQGGFLNVHTDFNFHILDGTHRRLNLIFYVNSEWREEWGGALELWNSDVSVCGAKMFPKFNRAVLFETSEISFHGHPIPMTCPLEVSRKSMAVYYYSDWPAGLERRAKTNYVLTPDQVGTLKSLIAQAIDAGAQNFEEAAEKIPGFQPAHIKKLFSEVKSARS